MTADAHRDPNPRTDRDRREMRRRQNWGGIRDAPGCRIRPLVTRTPVVSDWPMIGTDGRDAASTMAACGGFRVLLTQPRHRRDRRCRPRRLVPDRNVADHVDRVAQPPSRDADRRSPAGERLPLERSRCLFGGRRHRLGPRSNRARPDSTVNGRGRPRRSAVPHPIQRPFCRQATIGRSSTVRNSM